MSQQGPGGYGGGWGPPGGHGAPPGPPPGWVPPGGAPPGAPPGWVPPGQPAQPPYGAPPSKKTNPLVWLGIGCGVLALLAIGSGVFVFVMARNAARSAASAAGAFSAAVELAVDGGVLTFDAGAATGVPPSALTTGGPTCEKAAECCRRVLEKTGANPATSAACDQLRTATELGCQQALEVHRKSAPLLGTSCP